MPNARCPLHCLRKTQCCSAPTPLLDLPRASAGKEGVREGAGHGAPSRRVKMSRVKLAPI